MLTLCHIFSKHHNAFYNSELFYHCTIKIHEGSIFFYISNQHLIFCVHVVILITILKSYKVIFNSDFDLHFPQH